MNQSQVEALAANRLHMIAAGRLDSLCCVNRHRHCCPMTSDPICRQCLEDEGTNCDE